MRKRLFIFLLVLVSTILFSFFPRPWNEKTGNFNLLGIIKIGADEYVTNPYYIEKSVETVNINVSSSYPDEMNNKINICLNKKQKVIEDLDKINMVIHVDENGIVSEETIIDMVRRGLERANENTLARVKGRLEANNCLLGHLTGYKVKKYTVEKDNKTETHYKLETCSPRKTFVVTLDLSGLGNHILMTQYILSDYLDFLILCNDLHLTDLYIDQLGSINAFLNLMDDYINMLNACTDVADLANSDLNFKKNEFDTLYYNITYLGVGEPEYTGPGSDIFSNIVNEKIWQNQTSNLSYFVRADYNRNGLLVEVSENLTTFDNLNQFVQNTYKFVNEVNTGKRDMEELLNDINTDLNTKKQLYNSKLSKIKTYQNKIDKQKLYLIEIGYISTESGFSLNISSDIDNANKEIEEAKNDFIIAENKINYKPKYWVKDAYMNLNDALYKLTNVEQTFESILSNSQEVVSKLRVLVIEKRDKLKENNFNVDEINNEIEAGDKANTLGDKFVHYKRALYMMETISPSNQEIDLQNVISEVDDLIQRAKQDGLDTTYEENMLNYYLDLDDNNLKKEGLLEIKISLINKAEHKYSILKDYYNQINYYLSLDKEGKLSSFKNQFNMYNNMWIDEGYFSYSKGLGSLDEIKKGYENILNGIKDEISELSNGILIDLFLPSKIPTVNEEINLDGSIQITNPFSFELKNIKKEIEVPISLHSSDLDYKNIQMSGKKITILISSLKPYSTFTIHIHKTFVWVEMDKHLKSRIGINGETSELYDVLLDIKEPTNSFYLDKTYEWCYIDGKNRTNVERLNRLEEGLHEGTCMLNKEGIYDIKTNVSSNGSNIVEIITIKPFDSFDYIALNISNYTDIHCSNTYEIKNGYIYIYNIKDGKIITLTIVNHIINYEDTINELINKIKALSPNDEESNQLEYILNGGYTTKMDEIEKLTMLYNNILKRIKEENTCKKHVDSYLNYVNSEYNAINEVVDKVHNDELKDILTSRLNSLNDLKSRVENLEVCEAEVELRKYDKRWTEKMIDKWITNIFKDVSKKMKEMKDDGYYSNIENLFNNFKQAYWQMKSSENNYNALLDFENAYNLIESKYEQYLNETSSNEVVGQEKDNLKDKVKELEKNKDGNEEIEDYMPIEEYKKELNDIETLVNEKHTYIAQEKLKKLKEKIKTDETNLNKELEKKFNNLETLYKANKDKFSPEEQEKIEKSFNEIEKTKNKKEYGKTLNYLENLERYMLSRLKKNSSIDSSLILFLIGSVLIGVYYYKDRLMSYFKRKPKERKHLKKGSEVI